VDAETLGVYVHVPFCQRVCPYCDFAVVGVRRLSAEQEARYVRALLAELARRREDFGGRALASLYLGGGTPSLLAPESVAGIVEAVRAVFPARGWAETTLEVNPGTLERERLSGFRAAGVNRVSIGVQSFDDTTLRRLGRAHRAAEAHRTLAAAREAGFEAISLDLVFAAPGQDLAGFERDLEEALAFGPEHVSTYELSIEPGTPFATAAERNQLQRAAEEEVVAMVETAEARLEASGFERYELSNFARPGFAAVHNRRYWERRPVLGLGVGAFSTDPAREGAPFGVRRANARDLNRYLEAALAGRSAEAEPPEVLDAPTARGEAVFLALRSAAGLDARRFASEFGRPPRGFWQEAIAELIARGWLEERLGGDLRLTRRGRLLADGVFEYFV
jgi:oxygen-independent coproporphyrinogen-3 oxidase